MAAPVPCTRIFSAGNGKAFWKADPAKYDEMEGIAWRWQSVDGATGKVPLGPTVRETELHG
jgi:hypothetical protein